jgi:hypothetical protein
MNGSKTYESWRRRRSEAELPADFAMQVMAEVRQLEAAPGPGNARPGWAWRLLERRYVAAALFVAAALVGLMRLGSVTAMILGTPTEGY